MGKLQDAMMYHRLRKGQKAENREKATPTPKPTVKPTPTPTPNGPRTSDIDIVKRYDVAKEPKPQKPIAARPMVHPAMRRAYGVPGKAIVGDPKVTEVQITSEPMDARVYADDELVGNTPCPVKVEGQDIVHVRVSLKGYRSERLEVSAGDISHFVELERY